MINIDLWIDTFVIKLNEIFGNCVQFGRSQAEETTCHAKSFFHHYKLLLKL